MKAQIKEWLENDDREFEITEHEQLKWMIQVKHGDRVVLIGNPKSYDDRIEIVYKLNVSQEHQDMIKQLDNQQRGNFEKSLVMMLAEDEIIYNIQRNEDNLPDSVVIKRHLYEEDLNRTMFFDVIQKVVNMGMRATIHFQSLGGGQQAERDVSSTKPGPSLYR